MRDADYELLERQARLFNEGIWTGDFRPMVERFTEDAELALVDGAARPIRGRDAIAAWYRERPPYDEIRVSRPRREEEELVVDYAWARARWARAGEMRFTVRDGRITRLVVRFS